MPSSSLILASLTCPVTSLRVGIVPLLLRPPAIRQIQLARLSSVAAAQALGGRARLRLGRRFRLLARDYERLAATLIGLSFVVLACLMLQHWTHLP